MPLAEPYMYDQNYLMQHLGTSGALPPSILLSGVTYAVKPTLHCNLVPVKRIIPQLIERGLATAETAEAMVLAALEPAVAKRRPLLTQYLNEIRLAAQPNDGRQSIMIMVRVDHVTDLLSDLSAALQLTIPVPPTHVTLYTLPGPGPIGVTTTAELESLTRLLNPKELEEWHNQIDMKAMFGVTRL